MLQLLMKDSLHAHYYSSSYRLLNSSDVKLTLSSKDELTVSLNVHRQILVAHSRFFAVKLSDRWSKQQRTSNPYIVEIADCDDVEVYIEALSLMYCKDLRKKLMKEDVTRVLGILKLHGVLNVVSWGIMFPVGAIIARYLRTFQSADPAWFYLHSLCQFSSYVIGVARWGTGLKLGSESKGVQYTHHRNIGIALFCLATVQDH
ncbi:hypothetical protein CsSME_00013562 [Camellia sinensis var. sinensis]